MSRMPSKRVGSVAPRGEEHPSMGMEMMRRVAIRPSSTNRLRRTRSAHGFFCLTA